jgi:small subunit ribosomal protein S21
VDDNEFKIDDLKSQFPKIEWIKIREDECKKLGYQNINFIIKKGEPSAWDKAFCYFCEKSDRLYDYYWFIEDDVFIPKIDNLYKIDDKYRDDDILLNKKNIDLSTQKNAPNSQIFEVKKYMKKEYETSLCKSMVCIVRLSDKMMKIVKEYVNRYKTMFFLEFFLCTLANYHKVKMNVIEELSTIRFRRIWKLEEMKEHENINQALRRFKKKIEESGILDDVRKHEFYEKPTTERKRKKSAAKARWRKKLREQQLPQKMY